MAEPARADASDFFHAAIIPKADFFERAVEWWSRRAARRDEVVRLHRGHPLDRTGDPERIYSPSLPSSGE
eukprot:6204360-Pleurochrysis_carterae.AAC.1